MNPLLCLLAFLPLAPIGAPNPDEEKDRRQPVYRTEVVKRGALARVVQAVGTVEPENVIVDRRVNVGQTVAARLDTPSLFLIATDLSKIQVWSSVNEADIGPIQPGQTVRFTVKPYPDQVFQGRVSQLRLNAAMTKGVVTYTVVVQVDNPGGKLLPYLTADVHFVVGHAREAVLVPNAAVRWKPDPAQVAPGSREFYSRWQAELPDRRGGGRGLVWVKEKGHVRPLEVRLGASDGLSTEVVGGDLPEGTAVVVGTSSP